jgi:hypothetical protein
MWMEPLLDIFVSSMVSKGEEEDNLTISKWRQIFHPSELFSEYQILFK